METKTKTCDCCNLTKPVGKFAKWRNKCNGCRYLEDKKRKEAALKLAKLREELEGENLKGDPSLSELDKLKKEVAFLRKKLAIADDEIESLSLGNSDMTQELSHIDELKESLCEKEGMFEEQNICLVESLKDMISTYKNQESHYKTTIATVEDREVKLMAKAYNTKHTLDKEITQLKETIKTLEDKISSSLGEAKEKDMIKTLEDKITGLLAELKENEKNKDIVKDLESQIISLIKENKEHKEFLESNQSINRKLFVENHDLKNQVVELLRVGGKTGGIGIYGKKNQY